MGFLVANFEGRGTNGRGKVFRDALYQKLGIVEIDDQAAGVKYLRERPYVDGKRVGIQGTSYGGYSTVMCLLRYPDVFQVGCANSSVTDWHNYDSVYTERYEGLPDEGENKAGYDAGSAMTYAGNLAGRLMLYFGTADNNVHPSNTMQLVQALNQAGKRFDMMVGPDLGHTAISQNRMWEYFVQYLILDADKDPLKVAWGRRKKMKEASNRI
jgi:dipeptidyl-peptidase-4